MRIFEGPTIRTSARLSSEFSPKAGPEPKFRAGLPAGLLEGAPPGTRSTACFQAASEKKFTNPPRGPEGLRHLELNGAKSWRSGSRRKKIVGRIFWFMSHCRGRRLGPSGSDPVTFPHGAQKLARVHAARRPTSASYVSGLGRLLAVLLSFRSRARPTRARALGAPWGPRVRVRLLGVEGDDRPRRVAAAACLGVDGLADGAAGHRSRAGYHVGDGKDGDLLRYAAWLLDTLEERDCSPADPLCCTVSHNLGPDSEGVVIQ